MALLLGAKSVSKSYGIRTLFRDISVAFNEGERIGLIGPNGSGKSTLLRILAGLEEPDEGRLERKRNLRMAYIPQQDAFPDGATVEQVLEGALDELHLDEGEKLARASVMLGKVGFVSPHQPAADLSGGWRKRLALARELIKEPELLLMDEPTNHLDLEGIFWLEKLLAGASFAFLLVSHDRQFLENATNRTVELSRAYRQGYFSVSGPYSDFLQKREAFLEAQKAEQAALASRVRREIEWLQRGAKARTTKAKGRIEQAGKMMAGLAELRVRNAQDRAAAIEFSSSGRQTRKLIEVKGVSKTLGGRLLFKDLSFVIAPGMKLGLLGPNGSGKTTLIKMLAGELPPDSGTVKHAEALKVIRFEQGREGLDPAVPLKVALSPKSETITYRGTAIHVSGWARRFLFRTEQLDMPVGELSGGEQARIRIAQLMAQDADVLILDEPTNDLDISTLEVLEDSLEDFPGAVVLVTHDRFMLESLSTDIVGLDGQGGVGLYGDVSQWESAVRALAAKSAAAAPKSAAAPRSAALKPAAKRLSYMEQREWEQMETRIIEAEAELESARSEMESPAVMSDRNRLHAACERLGQAEQAVQQLYTRWAELEAKQK